MADQLIVFCLLVGGTLSLLAALGWVLERRAGLTQSTLPGHRNSPGRPGQQARPVLHLDPSRWSAKAINRLMDDLAAEAHHDLTKRPPRAQRALQPTEDGAEEGGRVLARWGRITNPARYQDVGDVFEQLGLTEQSDLPRKSEA